MGYLTTHTSLSPIRCGFAPDFVNYKKGALDSQPQVEKLTSCLSMVGGSLRVLRLLPPLKLVAMISMKYCRNTNNIVKLKIKIYEEIKRERYKKMQTFHINQILKVQMRHIYICVLKFTYYVGNQLCNCNILR